jgi:Domain of unknown function (DUF1992)
VSPKRERGKRTVDKWESIAERKIREAMDAGAFENLPSMGKPIPIDRNPFEDPNLWIITCFG